jgi:hypothetical protein
MYTKDSEPKKPTVSNIDLSYSPFWIQMGMVSYSDKNATCLGLKRNYLFQFQEKRKNFSNLYEILQNHNFLADKAVSEPTNR